MLNPRYPAEPVISYFTFSKSANWFSEKFHTNSREDLEMSHPSRS
jgi:hypothetical protein